MSSMGTYPALFEWGLLPPALFDMGTLDVAGVRFDVSGATLLRGGDSVHVVSRLMMSEDTGDGDWFPIATAARSRTGGFGSCGWLYCVRHGAGSSNRRTWAHRRPQPERRCYVYQDCVHSAGIN